MSSATQDSHNLVVGDWDLNFFCPEFLGSEYQDAWKRYREGLASAQQRATRLDPQLFLDWEELYQIGAKLGTYLGCLRSADGRNEKVAQEYAALQALGAEYRKFEVALFDLLKNASEAEFEALLKEPSLADASFRLKRWRETSRFQMNAELETLAAELDVDGMSAWGRLYDQVSGRLEFEMDGKKVPMALKRSLTESPDPAVRKQAQESSNRAWAEVEDVCAASLNAIAGTRLTLYKRRNIASFLEPPLFESAISQKTLDAMFGAIRQRFEVPRSYLRLKAKLIGKARLGFQDLSCPLPLSEDQQVSWEQSAQWLNDAYSGSYPNFAAFCRHALENRWVDYRPREGKRQGGYCTAPLTQGESRVFMTFNSTMGDVQTLAHEFGHAYHNYVMRSERPLNLQYPMTLAETASTFAETLLTDAMLKSERTSDQFKASLLNTRLDHASAFMLNIPMRFDFERRFYEERAAGEVTVSRLKELMLQAQRDCYGDTLNEDELDPYFWASKLHFYITEVSFYNFPYSFGYLFSLGVYAHARKEGPAFFAQYEELLRRSGRDTAENIAREALGVDLEGSQFWLDSIALVEDDLRGFEEQARKLFPQAFA